MPGVTRDLTRTPGFARLREVCRAEFAVSGGDRTLDFGLTRALGNLGCPAIDPVAGRAPISPEEGATRLNRAFRQTEVRSTHLLPLDMADRFARVSFDPANAGSFSSAELGALLEGPGGPRGRRPGLPLDHLSSFRWLVVEETTPLTGKTVQVRSFPELSFDMSQDFGRIVPHPRTRPQVVDDALFALLLLPWEDHDTEYNPEWRVFRVPWVYTVTDDLFARPPATPDLEALTETEVACAAGDGTWVETMQPYVIGLNDGADAMVATLDPASWARLEAARAHPLFAPPLAHFFIRAFFSDPIDEFLAHIMMLEAALGQPEDAQSWTRRQFAGGYNPGAKTRVAARLTALLGDAAAGRSYEHLFAQRSAYVHGRPMGDISSVARLQARALARRTASALVDLALRNGPASRDECLDLLLDAGIGPLRPRP